VRGRVVRAVRGGRGSCGSPGAGGSRRRCASWLRRGNAGDRPRRSVVHTAPRPTVVPDW
jgi:hypothetical protein